MTLIDFCQRLIQTESTPGREGAAVQLAAQEMKDLGYDEISIDAHGNLIGRVGPLDGPTSSSTGISTRFRSTLSRCGRTLH